MILEGGGKGRAGLLVRGEVRVAAAVDADVVVVVDLLHAAHIAGGALVLVVGGRAALLHDALDQAIVGVAVRELYLHAAGGRDSDSGRPSRAIRGAIRGRARDSGP